MSEFYDLQSLLAFPGATVAISLLCGAVSYLGGEGVKPWLKWVALVGSVILAGAGWVVSSPVALTWDGGLVAFVNGIVLFLAAVGGNVITSEKPTAQARGLYDAQPVRRTARQAWF